MTAKMSILVIDLAEGRVVHPVVTEVRGKVRALINRAVMSFMRFYTFAGSTRPTRSFPAIAGRCKTRPWISG